MTNLLQYIHNAMSASSNLLFAPKYTFFSTDKLRCDSQKLPVPTCPGSFPCGSCSGGSHFHEQPQDAPPRRMCALRGLPRRAFFVSVRTLTLLAGLLYPRLIMKIASCPKNVSTDFMRRSSHALSGTGLRWCEETAY